MKPQRQAPRCHRMPAPTPARPLGGHWPQASPNTGPTHFSVRRHARSVAALQQRLQRRGFPAPPDVLGDVLRASGPRFPATLTPSPRLLPETRTPLPTLNPSPIALSTNLELDLLHHAREVTPAAEKGVDGRKADDQTSQYQGGDNTLKASVRRQGDRTSV